LALLGSEEAVRQYIKGEPEASGVTVEEDESIQLSYNSARPKQGELF